MNSTFFNFLNQLLIPVLLLLIIALFSANLFVIRDHFLLQNNIEKENNPKETGKDLNLKGIGAEKVRSFPVTGWKQYYGGGAGEDTIVALTDQSLRITTGGDGGWYGARANFEPVDLSNSAVTLSVRFDMWKDVDRVLVMYASDDGEFQNYYGLNLKDRFAFPADDEWITVSLEKSEFEVIDGSPDWSHITDIAVRVVPKPAVATRVWFDNFGFVPKTASTTYVSVTFDDGFASVVDAFEIMNRYDMKGTAYIIPEIINTKGRLSEQDISILEQAGWDISAHGSTNLLDLLYSDVDTTLALVYKYLDTRQLKGKTHFAYPNGGYDDNRRSQVSEYFVTGRTIDGFAQPQDFIIPTKINARTISSNTSVDEIKKWIDDAKTDHSWLVLVWHDIVENDPKDDVQYKKDKFQEIIDFLFKSEVKVLPFSEAFEEITK